MAQKNANIRINLDNKQAVDGLNKINKSVKDTSKEVETATTRLGEMQDRLHDMKAGTKEFNKLEKEAAKLQRRVDTVNNRVTALSSSSFQLEGATQVVGGMVSAYAGLQGALALAGVENEKLMETLVKLQAVQMVSQSIQEVGLMFRKDSVAMIFLQTKAQKIRAAITNTNNRINRVANSIMGTQTAQTTAQTAATTTQTVATQGATLATRALSTAMKAVIPIALIAGIVTLVSHLIDWGDETETLEEKQKKANDAIEKNIELIDRQIESINKRTSIRQDRVDLSNEEEYLRLQRQILVAEQSLTKTKRDDADNTELILKRTKTLNNLRVRFAKLQNKRELEAFDRRVEATQEERQAFQEKQSILNESIKEQEEILLQARKDIDKEAKKEAQDRLEDLKKQRQSAHDEYTDLVESEINSSQARTNLEMKQSNELFKLRIDNANKVAEITKDITKETSESLNEELPSITLSLAQNLSTSLSKIPKTLDDKVLTPYAKALSKTYRDIYEEQQRHLAVNEELLGRSLENVYKLSDAIQSAIDQDFDAININMRMISENLLGPGGLFKRFQEEGKSFAEFFRENITEIVSEIGVMTTQVLGKMNSKFIEEENTKLDKLNESQSEALQKQLSEREISQEQYQNRIQELEQTTEMKRRQLARQEFRREKALALTDAGILTAKSIMQAIAQFGPPPSPAGIAGIAAATSIGGIQMGLISSQQFTAKRGGVVPGEGLGSEDSVPSMLAPGEVVINSKSAKAFLPLLSMMNEAGGGIQLAPDIESGNQQRPKVYEENKKQITETFVAFDSMDAMNKQVKRTIKNNTF